MRTHDQDAESLWWIAASPGIWLVHFLACYLTAALWCEWAVGPAGSLLPVRFAIGAYTLVGLGAVASVGWRSYRRHRPGESGMAPHDFDNREGRARFMGLVCTMLSTLSAMGILYVALPAFFVGSCR